MWILIIAAVIVAILYFSNKKLNKAEANYNLANGGFKKSFPFFTNYLEMLYGMSLVSDTGRSFAYSKQVNDINGNFGVLTVGVKLDMRGVPVIYSKFKNGPNSEFLGIDVSGVNFNNTEIIEECIEISINRIKEQGIIDKQIKLY
jgi:hypothetical protein